MDPQTRESLIQAADQWVGTPYPWGGDSKKGVDCSHFVWEAYKAVLNPPPPYAYFHADPGGVYFTKIARAGLMKGDLILFPGHVGMIYDPAAETFIGAQSSTGVKVASYKKGSYWGGRITGYERYKR